ncbi:MAG: response regulator [candidate division Zixibacteria bacterium]|nr:response regulator [candidate division Zixibacteria bacterium]
MSSLKVLVVDDETFVRDLLEEFLAKQGYSVVLAESGEQAVEVARGNDLDVALVDLKMPGIDGLETLNRLNKVQPHMPVIIMTGYPTIETSIKALRLGAYDYVVKPFKLNELKIAVEKALKERKLKVEIDHLRNKIKAIEGELQRYEMDKDLPASSGAEDSMTPVDEADNEPIFELDRETVFEQIRKLDELKQNGVLTDKEFETKKAELLARL